MSEERDNVLLSDVEDDTITIVDTLESRRNSVVPTALRTMSTDLTTNLPPLALARFVYRELVGDSTDNNLAFLTTEDADFVSTAARAAKEEVKTHSPFTIVYMKKGISHIPTHWIELISERVKRFTHLQVPHRSDGS